jgi:UDP-glucose 4-epimerase
MLASRGRPVVVVDISPDPTFQHPAIVYRKCDVTDYNLLMSIVEELEICGIVHTAAVLSTGMRADTRRGLEVNLLGTVNVLEVARQKRFDRVVIASSATVLYSGFESFDDTPIVEDAALKTVTERPSSFYAISKLTGEHLALLYRDLYKVPAVSLRFSAVLGGSFDTPSSVPGQLLKFLRDGDAAHGAKFDPLLLWSGEEEFIDARDCARANLAALDASDPLQGVYTITHTDPLTCKDFINSFNAALGRDNFPLPEMPPTGFAGFPHVRPARSDTTAAERELGFRCKYDFADTVRHCCAVER